MLLLLFSQQLSYLTFFVVFTDEQSTTWEKNFTI